MNGLQRRLAAVMFTDMAGYTALMQKDEAAALRARSRHREALEEELGRRGGQLLQYFGDGSLSIFGSSLDAVEAAVALQRALAGDPPLRIGIHAGDVAFDVQGAYGDAVNIAARLEARAPTGGIMISGLVYEDIRRHPIEVVSCGAIRLKNIAKPVPTFAVAEPGVRRPETPVPGTPRGVESGLPQVVIDRLDELQLRPFDAPSTAASVTHRPPLIGRRQEVRAALGTLDRAASGRPYALFVRGGRGMGKTRLAQELVDEARDRGWTVLRGRGQPGESREPYALFAEALLPLLGDLEEKVLVELTPGREATLCELFPLLGTSSTLPVPEIGGAGPGAHRTRLYWQFSSFMARLAAYRPVLLVLEDLDYADQASLDLLEFTLRQANSAPIALMGAWAGAEPESARRIRRLEQVLVAEGIAATVHLGALEETGVVELVRAMFEFESGPSRELGHAVYRWAGGNPFLILSTLRGLVRDGVLRLKGGTWEMGDLSESAPPASAREAVLAWIDGLDPAALQVASLLSILGRETSYEVLKHVSGMDPEELEPALADLLRHQLLTESESRWTLTYAFGNPLIRETLRGRMPPARRRELHGRLAEGLESFYGSAAEENAAELAYHFSRAHSDRSWTQALRYLVSAGEAALGRHANREAQVHLQESLELIEARPGLTESDGSPLNRVLIGLARARRRRGDPSGSLALWRRLLGLTRLSGDDASVARIHRQVGLTHLAAGSLDEAAEAFESAAQGGRSLADVPLEIQARLSAAFCLQSMGHPHRAAEAVEECLQLAEGHGDAGLLGQVYRSRIQYNVWTGEIGRAREAAVRALALARESGDRSVEFWSLWAQTAMEGLLGNTRKMARALEQCRAVADDIGSPFSDLATSELEIELAYATGRWDRGLEVAESALTLARSANERLIRPRILVWASMIHVGRGEYDEAEALTEEAWEVAGADRAQDATGMVDLHTVVPAHIGRASVALATGEWGEAVRIAEAGLRVADRSGYVVWAIHHILPIIAEASIHARDLDRAFRAGERMRREADRVAHPLGIAWADACDAVLTWLNGDAEAGALSLRKGAEALEAIPMTYEAARLRRQLAGRLVEVADYDGARRELLHALDVFRRIGARPELDKALNQIRELDGHNDPPTETSHGADH